MKYKFDEYKGVGTDYRDLKNVENYDREMETFRDYRKEALDILGHLNLPPGSAVLEIGTGTGHFTREAAREGYILSAMDVSPVMLEYARKKAEAHGLDARWINKGFLELDSVEEFDGCVSNMALHHLPDFWKIKALANIHRALKPGGKLFLGDVVFNFPVEESDASFSGWVEEMVKKTGSEMKRKNVEMHILEEFSTFDWIMEGLLERAGFGWKVLAKEDFRCTYLCEKI